MVQFAHSSAARRYALGRPFFHSLAVERIRTLIGVSRVTKALDVACGTGQSSIALAEIADTVAAVDISPEMLSCAEPHPRISYLTAPAENLPFPDRSFDLLTTGLAFHWFNRPAFLAEASRTLMPGGWLAIYNDGFSGHMRGNPDYHAWNRDWYMTRFPTPPRDTTPFIEEEAARFGFETLARDRFIHDVVFTPVSLVNYLVTQTNVIAAVEEGTEDIDAVTDWLLASVSPLFSDSAAAFPFQCIIHVLAAGSPGTHPQAPARLRA
jgi:SAM-dependent methyltransferase